MNAFIELVQIALGNRTSLTATPTAKDWQALYKLSQMQTLVGICFSGVEKLPAEQRPPRELIMQWWALTSKIETQNKVMDERTKETTAYFRKNGFNTAILKGQGIAQLYPQPERRQSGDIDIWVTPNDENDDARAVVYDFARRNDPEGKLHGVNYHHVHYHLFDDTEVELHIYPGYLFNPLNNRRLHQFFREYSPTDDTIPSLAFNRIFILLHIYNHFTGHGVGLRQVMDYYYVMRQGFTEEEQKETQKWLKRLGLWRFAGAVMWVMREAFGLEEEYMLVEPDEKEGRFLMEEIFKTGNMGHYEQRNWGSLKTPLSRFFFNLRRDWHFISHYPEEVCWQPFFSIWMNVRRIYWTKSGPSPDPSPVRAGRKGAS